MQFDYLYTTQATGSIDVDDVGDVVINATNFLYQEYFLIIKTELGRSKIIEYGPIFIDPETTPTYVSYTYTEIDYDMRKLSKIIDRFLNNPKSAISQVKLIELEEAIDRIKDLVSFL